MEWTVESRGALSGEEAWRHAVRGEPSPFFDCWAPPTVVGTTMTPEVIGRWVNPLCSSALDVGALESALGPYREEISVDLVRRLLSERTWRARIAGGYLAALRRYAEVSPAIGGMFLRSETPYAGQVYCLALTRIGDPGAVAVLSRYLEFYLTQNQLIYDQCAAIAGIACLDRARGTSVLEGFRDGWAAFASDKPELDLDQVIAEFSERVDLFAELEERLA